ncbi:hypothetical protein MBLNU230_g0863t1 [Neophaeotheca triangularis]
MKDTMHKSMLNKHFLHFPADFDHRYTHAAECELRRVLFKSLANQSDEYLRYFFPQGTPPNQSQPWSLKEAQGAVEGAEYTEAARGTACGHIFKNGEATYHCSTCAIDDTCVLCAKCFECSDHEGHQVFISCSPGNSGCCDCGDKEAWKTDVNCSIHTDAATLAGNDKGKAKGPAIPSGQELPQDLVDAIRTTISRTANFLVDVFSCSPEQLRHKKDEKSIKDNERMSRLHEPYGQERVEEEPEYALVLWNDEKHTVEDVEQQVARACRVSKRVGFDKAMEVNDIGRSVVSYSRDIQHLLSQATILEQLKLTVTIRSSRDTFREQMCSTIIDWMADISGCSVGHDAHMLRNSICEELLGPWQAGSPANNKEIGLQGIDDHDWDDIERARRRYATWFQPFPAAPAAEVVRVQVDDLEDDGEDEDNGDDVGEDDEFDGMDVDEEDVERELLDIRAAAEMAADMEAETTRMEVDIMDDEMDAAENLEATIAGYPPPPPPPAREESVDEDVDPDRPNFAAPYNKIPKTPRRKNVGKRKGKPSRHWLEKPEGFHRPPSGCEPAEDLWQRVRLDYLILYDLRLWKTLRIKMRHLYITTVVTVADFKRLLGLRFAGLYTTLAQLYLIADREPDHSIINLSVQMLTTPSITEEVLERGNFLTNLMAILYTFLTTRQVGFPEDVNPQATLAFDAGAVTNRRMFHFFCDMRWLSASDFVRTKFRTEQRYLLQFLDLVKLHQGVCPNIRATGEHVEYESDAWISASMIIKEINKLCKQVATSFGPAYDTGDGMMHLQRAIRTTAQVTMINSFGYESKRFRGHEIRDGMPWHSVGPFESSGKMYSIPRHVVQSEPNSFHHPLHYMLSWLIEDANTMSREEMRALLDFSHADLKDPWNPRSRGEAGPKELTNDELLSSIFEHPLRLCVWLAQMRAGMWVRNGITLRHQAHTYRSVALRDVGYQRDITLLQTAFVLCGTDDEPVGARFLAQMVNRFQLDGWVKGVYSVMPGFEESQQLDVIEDFFHLLVVCLSERGSLVPAGQGSRHQDKIIQHDIAHALCFKPLSFSDLTLRITEKITDSDEFDRVLEEMTNFRAPEGLSDTGTFELRPEYFELIDPYFAHYSRNHREEAENIYKSHMARKTGQKAEDVVYQPHLEPLKSGLYVHLAAFTRTDLFVQIVWSALNYAADRTQYTSSILPTRIETFLHMVLHLIVVAFVEDVNDQFVMLAASTPHPPQQSLVSLLVTLSGMEEYSSCHATIKHILRQMQLRQPEPLSHAMGPLAATLDRANADSPASLSAEDKQKKKQESLARQARVMAQMKQQQNSFLQMQGLDDIDDEIDDLDDDMSMVEPDRMGEKRKTWDFPVGTCILCQEEADDRRLYGTFAFLGESNLLRTTPLTDPDFVQEVADTPVSLDRSADNVRPFGVAGHNKRTVEKVSSEGKTVTSEYQGLSKGFPHRGNNGNARKGSVATSCGHIMHFSCFEQYTVATRRRHTQQIARNHPERTDLYEFICPLCKALGNTFVPIVWKPKDCAHDNELHAAEPLSDWLPKADRDYQSQFVYYPEFSPDEETETAKAYREEAKSASVEASQEYVANAFVASLAAGIQAATPVPRDTALADREQSADQPSTPRPRGYSGFTSLFGMRRGGSSDGTNAASSLPQEPRLAAELKKAYKRMNDAIMANELGSGPGRGDTENPSSVLARVLGYTISTSEIANRGMGQDPFSRALHTELSEQNLTHLRILSETASSHQASANLSTSHGELDSRRRDILVTKLFGTKPRDSAGYLLLEDDSFLFLTEWVSHVGMANTPASAINVLQTLYWAEIVKAVLVYSGLVQNAADQLDESTSMNVEVSDAFRQTVQTISTLGLSNGVSQQMSESMIRKIRLFVDKYALVFLRKSIILMHVRYGLDFACPYDLNLESPELQRLSAMLHVWSIDDLCALHTSQTPGGQTLQLLTKRWCEQASSIHQHEGPNESMLSLSHPAIFELVGLPKNYDTLTQEAIRRKCPTTGREITDPAVCLFCGAIFCSQAVCCMKDKNKGGCHQHMSACGEKIGIFINIRKCMVLFTHGPGNGSYAHAPYLDKHGEPDPTLRRHHQLFLNQKRYDKLLRDVWLSHGVPTFISRKLEGDINPGGFETL